MTGTTSMPCARCGGNFAVEVGDLSDKDSDSIACPCCGSTMYEWHEHAHSYSIRAVEKHGNVFDDGDVEALMGKQIRLEKGGRVYYGTVKGRAPSPMAAGPQKVIFPMLIETADADVAIAPHDGWRVCFCQGNK